MAKYPGSSSRLRGIAALGMLSGILIGPASAQVMRGADDRGAEITLVWMAAAASKAGADCDIMLSIASVLDDARALKTNGTLPAYNPHEASAYGSKILHDVSRQRAGGLFGYDDKAWLKAVSQEISKTPPAEAAFGPSDKPALKATAPSAGADAKAVLKLRQNPLFSIQIAARRMAEGVDKFVASLQRRPSAGEMFSIHLFGSEAAVRLAKAAAKTPLVSVGTVIGSAARNPAVQLYLLDGNNRQISVASYTRTTETVMERKLGLVRRFLERYRA